MATAPTLVKSITSSPLHRAASLMPSMIFRWRFTGKLGIVGESGSGKSVTSFSIMRLLAGTGRIDHGRISFLGKDLVRLPEPEMRKIRGKEISMIFQEPMTSLNPVFTAGWQVMEAIMLHQKVSKAEARKRTVELFREVGMPEPEQRVDSYPHQLSGGQKQRVMIAMALSCNPKLLIADEPSTALDVTIQAQILDILRELRDARGMSILFITHDLGVIAEIADEVAVMFQGKIVEQGKVLDIFENPKHPYTKGLLACKPRLETKYKTLPTVADFMEVSGEGPTLKIVEKQMTPERLAQLTTQGRGRMLHPKAQLKAMGHPWEDGRYPEDTTTVNEGTRPLLSVKDLKVHFPIRRGIFSARSARESGGRHQLRRLPRADAGPRRRIGLRQDDRRPRDPAAARAGCRPGAVRRR
jgi:peptide/nickel transport system ATP-binding protein